MTPPPQPLVSVVVDCYDYADYLPAAIESALGQTYPRVEVVVVDDGSTDGSADVAARYEPRVRLVRKANGGQGSAVNAGVAACAGDLVVVLDADDELLPTAVERAVAAWTPDVAKVHWRLSVVDAAGRPVGRTEPVAEVPLADGDVVPVLLARGRYPTPVLSGNAWPRWVLDRLLPVPEDQFRTSVDDYLSGLAPLHGPVRAVEEVLGLYRVHGRNASKPRELNLRRLRRRTEVDHLRNTLIHRTAARLGITALPESAPVPDIGVCDKYGLRARLVSLRLDPAQHPVPGDDLARLARVGAGQALSNRSAGRGRRLVVAAWFLVVAHAPLPVARRAVHWLYSPALRPGLLRLALRVGRHARRG